MKLCYKCKLNKDESEFGKGLHTNGLNHWCKKCTNERTKTFYSNNKKRANERSRLNHQKTTLNLKLNLLIYLNDKACVDCGENDILVFHFDHVRGTKIANIAQMLNRKKWEDILLEIEKCDIVCANCHAKRTAKQFNYYSKLENFEYIQPPTYKSYCEENGKIPYKDFEKIYQKIYDKNKRILTRLKFNEYMSDKFCVDCNETNKIVLQCDHVKEKRYNIARIVAEGASWEKISSELERCEIVCVNCHLRRTAKQFSWFKLEYQKGNK